MFVFFYLLSKTLESIFDKKGFVVFEQTRGGRGENAILQNKNGVRLKAAKIAENWKEY